MYCRSGGRCFMDGLQRRIRVARGEIPAELVLRNARLVNVCSGECYPADIAIADGRVVGISAPGEGYRGHEERDFQGRWLAPGRIDCHMHIESTMLFLSEFARIVTPLAVTVVILNPHEFPTLMRLARLRYVL